MKTIAKLFSFVAVAVAALSTVTFTTSCDAIARQAQGAYNMVNCKYEYRSLSGISVAGINVSQGLSLLDAPKILTLLSGGTTSIPVGFVVNLDVKNPNATEAFLSGLDYVLSIDDIEFTAGSVAQPLSIPASGTGVLPLAMSFDVATLLKGESRDAIVGIVRNLAGIGGLGGSLGLGASSRPSKVTLNIRPAFDVAGYRVVSPVFIPISFSFGGN